MGSLNKNHRRVLGFIVLSGVVGACSVDTSDVHFVPDDVLAIANGGTGAGGDTDTGGVANMGGVVNVAGMVNKAGTTGKAGAGNGGSSTTGGVASAGSSVGGATGMGGMGGMGGMINPSQCKLAAGNATDTLIDDLEDGNPRLPMIAGREGGWYVSNDATPGGQQLPVPSMMMPPAPERPGAPRNGVMSAFAMHTSGSGFESWGANMGLTLLQPPGGPACPYDVSRHGGVRFWIRTDLKDSTVRFAMPTLETHAPMQGGTCPQRCGDHYGFNISPVPGTWTQIEVKFADMRQQNFGIVTMFYPAHVLNVEFSVTHSVDFDFWVDQLEFF
jgi:hypothetical protein